MSTGDVTWHTSTVRGRFLDAEGRVGAGSAYQLSLLPGAGTYDWQCSAVRKVAPADAHFYRITNLGLDGSATGEAWFDAISFRPYAPTPRTCGEGGGQGSVDALDCAVSMRGGTSTWCSPSFSAEAGRAYRADWFARSSGAAGEDAELRMSWADAAGTPLPESTPWTESLSAEHQRFTSTEAAPPDAASLALCFSGAAGSTEWLFLDSIQLLESKTTPVPEPHVALGLAAGVGLLVLLSRRSRPRHNQ